MYKKIAFGSGVLFALGILIGFIGFPMLLSKLIRSQVTLKPGAEVRQMWERFPFAVNFSVYVFNVTNPDEIERLGGKPILEEVGPFVFEEWKDKYNLEDNEDEDTVTFNMRNTFIFRPDLGLSGEEVIVMPHLLVQAMAIAVKRDKAAMINVIAEGIDVIFKPSSAFLSAPFMDIFFRGLDVDCSSDNFASRAICLQFHTGNVNGGTQVNETHFKFSLMGGGNHSDAGRFKVARGIRQNSDIGRVLEFNDEPELSVWDGEECNRFRGTDSTIFAPLHKPKDPIWTFSAALCRSLAPKFHKKVIYAGIPVTRYIIDLGDVKNEPENHCFCKRYPDVCPPQGTMDLSLCTESPMIASLPHFLRADPRLLADIEGLKPLEEKHAAVIDFETISGTPLSIANRLQFNLDVQAVPEIPVLKNLRSLLMPLFWVQETANLNATYTDKLKNTIFFGIKANNAFKWLSTIIGASGILLATWMLRGNRIDANQVTEMAPANAVQ